MRWLIVDGYSLLHRDPQFAEALRNNLQFARSQLVAKLEKISVAPRTTIVFDGQGPGAGGEKPSPIEVIFSPAHQTADTVIERLVCSDPDPSGVMVVTSDRAERETVTAAGAQAMSCASFLELIAADRANIGARLKSQARSGKPTIGDIFPR